MFYARWNGTDKDKYLPFRILLILFEGKVMKVLWIDLGQKKVCLGRGKIQNKFN